jgi:predicted Zn-dependent protease
MADMLGRIILAIVAVALAAVTALELRAELDYQHGQKLFSDVSQKGFAADDVEHARDSLERASDLRPGTTALVAQAFLEKSAGNPEGAEALARQATRREPENVATWQALLSTSRDADERARAQQELLELDPLHGER